MDSLETAKNLLVDLSLDEDGQLKLMAGIISIPFIETYGNITELQKILGFVVQTSGEFIESLINDAVDFSQKSG